MTETIKPVLTPGDVCEILSISRRSLARLIKDNKIAVSKLTSQTYRFRREDVERFINENTEREKC